MRTRLLNLRNQSHPSPEEFAKILNPILSGWIAYYGSSYPSAMWPIYRHANYTIRAWIMRKYKRLRGRNGRARMLLSRIATRNPFLFAHCALEGSVRLSDGNEVRRASHASFCEMEASGSLMKNHKTIRFDNRKIADN
jgi:hypothetical protein